MREGHRTLHRATLQTSNLPSSSAAEKHSRLTINGGFIETYISVLHQEAVRLYERRESHPAAGFQEEPQL